MFLQDLHRLENESLDEWQVRCCLAKENKTTDLDWCEIRDMLGLSITPDQLRKQSKGILLYDKVLNSDNYTYVSNRILSISDLHIPFNLPLNTFESYAGKVNTLVLNGDIEDAQNVSKYPRKYRVHFTEEMILTRQYIIDLINMISPKTVVVVKGNHEHRMGRYLSKQLHDDVFSLMPDSPMDLIVNDGFKYRDRLNKTETWYSPITEIFEEKGIEISYTGEWWRKIGKVIFAHPLSYSSGMLKTTEKAVEYFSRIDRDFEAMVLAHTHKVGSYFQGNIEMYEQGCCCDLSKLDYTDGYLTLPGQNGFIYMSLDKNGSVIKNKTKLINI